MMRILVFAALCNVLPVILAHVELINQDLGDLHLSATVGRLPPRYTPLTKRDQEASAKAADFVDFIQLVPNIDPLRRESLPAVGIDLPFLWFKGSVCLNNVLAAGIKQLVVRDVELRMNNLRSDLNITIPVLHLEADLQLQASFSFISMVFGCHVGVNLMDVDVIVSTGSKIVQAPGDVVQVNSALVDIYIRNVQYNITNAGFGSVAQDYGIGKPMKQLFKTKSRGNFYDGLLQQALDFANQQLLTVPAEFFANYLFPDF